jgi:hypothetical protein
MTLQKLPSASTAVQDWRDLYLSALFETDRQKLPSRIAIAEKALLVHSFGPRELLVTSEQAAKKAKLWIRDFMLSAHCVIASR